MEKRTRRMAHSCRAEAVVDAPVDAVWQVVADVTRTGEWSHEVHRVEWLKGAVAAVPGARFRGRNRAGLWRWTRQCEVLSVDRPHEISWRTVPTALFVDSTDWRITLEPVGERTRIVQTFQVTKCPRWWEWIVARVIPRHVDRSAALTEDLRRIGAVSRARRHDGRSSVQRTVPSS